MPVAAIVQRTYNWSKSVAKAVHIRDRIQRTRLKNLRKLIAQHSTAGLARQLGYSSGTFVTQMAGPTPTRKITEGTARTLESALGLPLGDIDRERPTHATLK